jgi:hypothetical protein
LAWPATSEFARLARNLIGWQWPDGGWNCDKEPGASHSSFNETVTPMGGLGVYAAATGDPDALRLQHARPTSSCRHAVYKSHTTGEVGNPKWLELRYPPYWRYDIAQGMLMLTRAAALPDSRASDAAEWLRSQQSDDAAGDWPAARCGSRAAALYRDPARWERAGPSQMLTPQRPAQPARTVRLTPQLRCF